MVFLPTSHHHDTTVGTSQLLIRKTSLSKEGIKRKCNTSCRPCSHMTADRLQHDAFDSYSRQVHQVSAIPNHYVTPPKLCAPFRGTYLQCEVENNNGTRWTSSWVVLGLAHLADQLINYRLEPRCPWPKTTSARLLRVSPKTNVIDFRSLPTIPRWFSYKANMDMVSVSLRINRIQALWKSTRKGPVETNNFRNWNHLVRHIYMADRETTPITELSDTSGNIRLEGQPPHLTCFPLQ